MKKGFTLVELLAVIVILAIILVMAVPQIVKTIEQARISTIESSAKIVAAAAEREYSIQEALGNDVSDFLKGFNCTNATWTGLTTDDYSECTIIIENKKAIVNLTGSGKFIDYEVINATKTSAIATKIDNTVPAKAKVWTYTDINENNQIDIGDTICVEDQCFHIIENNGTNVRALSFYNLNAGGHFHRSNNAWSPYDGDTTGLQDSDMKGDCTVYTVSPTYYEGTTPFSSSDVHGEALSSYDGSMVKIIADNYKDILENNYNATIESIGLLTKEDLNRLINDNNDLPSGSISSKANDAGMSYLYNTGGYWLGTPYYSNMVWQVRCNNGNMYADQYTSSWAAGVRPVIEISLSDI